MSRALKSDGTLWSWGKNNKGQLGLGHTDKKYIPSKIGTAADTNWVEVFVSGYHTIARRSDNTLWGWGNNAAGQLGLGDQNNRTIPNKVGGDKDWAKAVVGKYHTVALKTDGSLWAWGKNAQGQLGIGSGQGKEGNVSVPTQVGTDKDWVEIFIGTDHTIALKEDGTLWSWGKNSYGQLGLGDKNPRRLPSRIP